MIHVELSKTEQDYIKAIYEIECREKQELVSLKDLVQKLGLAAPTVTEMVKRLEKKELLIYQSYKGVHLTTLGNQEARFILKAHRIWEYFLLENLGYQEADVHVEAEMLEHAASPKLIERLYEYLGKPHYCPHGNEIPSDVFWFEEKQDKKVGDLAPNKRARIKKVSELTQQFLAKMGIEEMPKFVTLIEKLEDGSLIVQFEGPQVYVIPKVYQKGWMVLIYVRRLDNE